MLSKVKLRASDVEANYISKRLGILIFIICVERLVAIPVIPDR